jgi:hypothetical protein
LKNNIFISGGIGFGAMLILKQYEIIKCDHYPSISAEKCFQQILIKDQSKKYFLASQVCFFILF